MISSRRQSVTKLYNLALEIAKEAHKDQKDKAGVDYIQHPIFVASLVDSEEEKAAALLHDVIEDSDFTLSDLLERGVPGEVLQAVSILTKSKQLSYQQYLERVKSNELARKVKLADLRHNSDISRIQNPSEIDFERIKKYNAAIEYLNNES
ncbi:HD domain-containing protein [Enterococcus sp. BWR-S5]|uniref:HD domain-containing protein n=1 Tax=Enterococcus sp. BWR-S5 TaxID=2787714 RepID=UPI001922BB94|nr:HD domain-containing protein [Enterococcus sp. BWR-S5]MBL1225376.1 HD domain-containing protein [Enterococcus sp. BWR-S5]